jgi:hypothetical protein
MKHKTDLTPNHHPNEYQIIAPEGHPIYIGTKEQCEIRMNEIANFDCDYAPNCKIILVS